MRLIIAGSKDTTQEQFDAAICAYPHLPAVTDVIILNSTSFDAKVREWVRRSGVELTGVTAHLALGRKAWPIRNRTAAALAHALLAVPPARWHGSGTLHVIRACQHEDLDIFVFDVRSMREVKTRRLPVATDPVSV